MSFSPNKADFESGMERVVGKLEETVLCIQPLVMDPVFFPFTRPVLYGKQEDLAFKEGPSLQASSYTNQCQGAQHIFCNAEHLGKRLDNEESDPRNFSHIARFV